MRLWECGEIGGGSAVVSRVVVLAMMYTQSITYMDIEGESLSSHDLFSGEISETFLSLTCLGMKMFIVQFPPNNHSWFLSTNLPKKPFPWLTIFLRYPFTSHYHVNKIRTLLYFPPQPFKYWLDRSPPTSPSIHLYANKNESYLCRSSSSRSCLYLLKWIIRLQWPR